MTASARPSRTSNGKSQPEPVLLESLDEGLLQKLYYLQELQAELAELEQQRLRAYQNDPVAWAQDYLKTFVWSKQREVLAALVTHRKVAVRSCHNIGKSYLAALAAAWWISTHEDAFVVTTAPTFNQVKVVLWRYIRRLHRQFNLPGRVNQTEWLIDEDIVAYGRKPADQDATGFQGIHAAHVLVILDEACGVPDTLWDAADSLTSNEGCRMLAIGNPDVPSTRFHLISEPGSTWHSIRISAFDSPNFTGEEVPDALRRLLISRTWVDEKAKDWGVDNPVYISKVTGEFPEQSPHGVVRITDVNACRIIDPVHPYAPDQLLPVELGVDVGGGGDLTVVRERRGIATGRQWTNHSDRPEALAPFVLDCIRATGATHVKVDSIGIGWGLVGELRNMATRGLHDAVITAVNVSEKSTRPDKYKNLRSQIWWEIGRNMLSSRAADLASAEDCDTLVAELLMPRWTENLAGQIEVEKKDDIRERAHGRSPDHADAWLLAYYKPVRSLDPFMTELAKLTAGGRTV